MLHRLQQRKSYGVNKACCTSSKGEDIHNEDERKPLSLGPSIIESLSTKTRVLVLSDGVPSRYLKFLSVICLWLTITSAYNHMVAQRCSAVHPSQEITAVANHQTGIPALVIPNGIVRETYPNDIPSNTTEESVTATSTNDTPSLIQPLTLPNNYSSAADAEHIFGIAVQIFPTVDDKRERADTNRSSHITADYHVSGNIGWRPVQETDSKHSQQLIDAEEKGDANSLLHTIPNNPYRELDIPNGADDSDGMAACLLVKDDNHLLVEWIAYHYITLPLRHLVIALDPDRFTSPDQIIQRWNKSYIDIRLWEDSDYMDQAHVAKRLRQKSIINSLKNKDQRSRRLAQSDEDRYTHFMSKCNLFHKSRGRKWVAHIEVNEYIVFNGNVPQLPTEVYSYNPSIKQNTTSRSHMSTENRTVVQVMSLIAKDHRPQWAENGCIAMSSLLFGSRETGDIDTDNTKTSTNNITSIDIRKLNTYRYRYHSKEVIKRVASGDQQQKGIILNVLQQSHLRPSKVLCLQDSVASDNFIDRPLKIHRYLGPWEQYGSKLNDITNQHDRIWYDKQAGLSSSEGPNHDIPSWMDRFVLSVGLSGATHLLYGVGNIDTTTVAPTATTQTKCALIFFGIPRAFTTTIFPSIKKYILDVNPSCDIFVHSYNFTTFIHTSNLTDDLDANFRNYHKQMRDSNKELFYELQLETAADFHRLRNLTFYRQLFTKAPNGKNQYNTDNMIRHWHSIESGWKLLEAYENKVWNRYERVGFFRLDSFYTHPINVMSTALAVIPPNFHLKEEPSGVNDRLFFGSRDIGKIWASERFHSIPNFLSWYKSIKKGEAHHHHVNSKEFLMYLLVEKWALRDIISLRNICIQRVRPDGKVQKSDCEIYGKARSGEQTVRGVVVLGMHRSGTSLLSGLLVRGLSYLSPGEAIPANEQNPYGFFENVDVCRQNDIWLKEQGRTWDMIDTKTLPTNSSILVKMFSPSDSCATNSCFSSKKKGRRPPRYFRHRNNALYHYNNPAISPWIMKDPRLCVTLKLWLQVLNGAPPAVIFTYRSPVEVARSLAARSVNQVKNLSDGLRLWIWYNRLALENSKGLCRVLTR